MSKSKRLIKSINWTQWQQMQNWCFVVVIANQISSRIQQKTFVTCIGYRVSYRVYTIQNVHVIDPNAVFSTHFEFQWCRATFCIVNSQQSTWFGSSSKATRLHKTLSKDRCRLAKDHPNKSLGTSTQFIWCIFLQAINLRRQKKNNQRTKTFLDTSKQSIFKLRDQKYQMMIENWFWHLLHFERWQWSFPAISLV